MNGFSTVIPAKVTDAPLPCGYPVTETGSLIAKPCILHALDSGFRRSDGVVISYAIALRRRWSPAVISPGGCRHRPRRRAAIAGRPHQSLLIMTLPVRPSYVMLKCIRNVRPMSA